MSTSKDTEKQVTLTGQAEYISRIRLNLPSMSEAERRVADLIMEKGNQCVHLSIRDLAAECSVSIGTVVRFCKMLGYSGYAEMKFYIQQGELSINQNDISISNTDDINTIKNKAINFTRESIKESILNTSNANFEAAIDVLSKAQRIFICGMGSASGISTVAAGLFMSLGLPAYSIQDPLLQMRTVTFFQKKDVVIGISYDGYSKDTGDVMMLAKKVGATTILISSNNDTLLNKYAHIKLQTAIRNTANALNISTTAICQLATIQTLQIGVWLKVSEQLKDKMKEQLCLSDLKRYDLKQDKIEFGRVHL